MPSKLAVYFLATLFILSLMAIPLSGCSSKTPSPSPTPSPTATSPGIGGGAVVNSDSVITAQIKSITKEATGFPWQLDILINSSQAVGNLPNPVADKTGQVVTVKTDEDLSKFQVGDNINGKIKYVGDVPKPGITLYLYNVTKQATY
jgi:hypothetical protein